MNSNWAYAELASKAKKAGGPENFTDSLIRSGVDYGRTTMIPWLGVAFFGGCLSLKICEAIYERMKERKRTDLEKDKERMQKITKECLKEETHS